MKILKKKSKIKIIKDNEKSSDNYTFISDDIGISSTQNAKDSPNDEVISDDTRAIDVNNLNEIRTKKRY